MIKLRKEILAIILGVSVGFSCVPASLVYAANENNIIEADYVTSAKDCIFVDGASVTESKQDAIKWSYNVVDKKYYLYLPASADLNNLRIWNTFSQNVTVDGKTIVSGEETDVFSEGEHTLTAGDKSYTVVVMVGSGLSSMFISTDEHDLDYINTDKENEDSGKILITKEDGSVDYDSTFSKIKGRGNTTWTKEKKPYNMTLDKKAGLLGMDESKKWCLLANYNDAALLRDQVAYDLAHECGLEYSPNSKQVNLYVNGEYQGVYQLCEKVELGKNNLVKANDLEKATEKVNDKSLDSYEKGGSQKCVNGTNKYFNIPNNPEDITGGYLLEYEMVSRYADSESGFVSKIGQPVICKSPEYASKEQVEYISSFFQDFEDALNSEDGYNEKGKHYSDYVDVSSLAKMYFVQELSKNVDVALTSFYFYKDSDLNGDGKLHATPAWDFDIAFGNYNDTITDERSPLGLLVPTTYIGGADWNVASSVPTIFTQLFKHQDFVTAVCNEWTSNFYDTAKSLVADTTSGNERLKSIKEYQTMLDPSAKMNFNRWDILGDNLTGVYEGETYDDVVGFLFNFLDERIKFLDKVYREDGGKGDVATRTDDNTTVKVYFDNSEAKWNDVSVSMYTYDGSLPFTTIPMEKVEGTDDLYYAEVSTVNDDIFFNSGDWSKKTDTTKEPLGNRNCYKVYNTENGSIGRWYAPKSNDNTGDITTPSESKLSLETSLNSWPGAYQITFNIKNTSEEAVENWSLKIKKENLDITSFWSVDCKEDGDYLIITPKEWNSSIAPGQTVSFGIQASGTGSADFEYELIEK